MEEEALATLGLLLEVGEIDLSLGELGWVGIELLGTNVTPTSSVACSPTALWAGLLHVSAQDAAGLQ